MRRRMTDCIICNDVTPRKQPVQAKSMSREMSNHIARGSMRCRWMKSVTMYGALGKKSSHMNAGAITIQREVGQSRSRIATQTAQAKGIHARKRFHTRNMYWCVCER